MIFHYSSELLIGVITLCCLYTFFGVSGFGGAGIFAITFAILDTLVLSLSTIKLLSTGTFINPHNLMLCCNQQLYSSSYCSVAVSPYDFNINA